MIDNVIQDSALALQTKVDILAWIGLMPEPLSFMTQLEVRLYRTSLTDPTASEELKGQAIDQITKLHTQMDEGLGIIMHKLNSDDCTECGKCDNLKEVLQGLLDGDDIHGITHKVTSDFGDISKSHGNGMPGESTRPPIGVLQVGGSNPGAEMLKLLKMIAGDDISAIGTIEGDSIPKNLFDSIFGAHPDKDKMH